MKPINQNLRFFIHVPLLAFFSFVMTPSAIAGNMWQSVHFNTNEHYAGPRMADTLSQPVDHQNSSPTRLLMVADNAASETDTTVSEPANTTSEADMQALRQKMIEDCEDNRGTDCEKQVDTELRAQELGIVHTAPPDLRDMPVRPRPRPRAR